MRKAIYRVARIVLSAALLAAGMLGCGSPDKGSGTSVGVLKDEILLGNSSATTGHAGFLGTQYLRGHDLVFSEVNRRGGIHGRRIRVVAYDDQYDPPRTVANTRKLIEEDQVFMLFGYVGTPTSVKVVDLVHEAEIPAFGFFTGAEALRTPFRPRMFHVRASYYAEAEAAVAYFIDHLGLERLAVVYQDDAFGYAVLGGVQLALQRRDREVTATATIVRGSTEVQEAVETIQASAADAVIMVGTYTPLAGLVRLCHDRGYHPYFDTVSFVGSEAYARELIDVQEIDRDQFDRIIVTQVVPSPLAEDYEAVVDFRQAYVQAYPDEAPNYVALEGFVNARVLVHALEAAGPQPTRKTLVEALETLKEFDTGVGQLISYGPNDRKGLGQVYYSKLDPEGTFRTFTH